ncbi:Phosphohistidine phosphatase SixA [Nitrincola lacisaponensis]|uniref:Phosphohistidine phosphatase SixA n=1 Tax=Nitrincola lacisaponensis TaxID=267850 RepID=A0A063Y284_9GAMM|nr:histidine phosphatase family protein [Nitrincola lacisaponensis]KDE40408.1 Phosphohistidine phosphatase SixA [Nitrincola lacisaponensis]
MKYLTLVRHAKSSWKAVDLPDFERPLNKRGKRDLPALCERLIAFSAQPDRLLFSPATRTRLTAERIIERLSIPLEHCQECPDCYEACTTALLEQIQIQPDSINHLMLVGHNPGLQDLGSFLLGDTVPHFPTSAVLQLQLDIDHWSDCAPQTGRCLRLDYPGLHAN